MKLHPILPGLWCVPSALYALTGADPLSVIHPALNRHTPRADSLLGLVTGASISAALATLAELGYTARRYRADITRAHVATWAARSRDKYPDRAVLLFTSTHALVAQNGCVYDNWSPHGPEGAAHPYAKTPVVSAFLVEKS